MSFFLDDIDLIVQVFAYDFALWEQLMHLDVVPLYVKVAVMEADQRVVPSLAFVFTVLVFVMVLLVFGTIFGIVRIVSVSEIVVSV
ncbi:hypothetical protein D7V86_03310 [bacterium D16-51]|nr:hypothetical protein D7V96_26175 [bacterium D16-59]RKI62154.1 hypothetical protein D7V86_03310 [bacterium D16-51]